MSKTNVLTFGHLGHLNVPAEEAFSWLRNNDLCIAHAQVLAGRVGAITMKVWVDVPLAGRIRTVDMEIARAQVFIGRVGAVGMEMRVHVPLARRVCLIGTGIVFEPGWLGRYHARRAYGLELCKFGALHDLKFAVAMEDDIFGSNDDGCWSSCNEGNA